MESNFIEQKIRESDLTTIVSLSPTLDRQSYGFLDSETIAFKSCIIVCQWKSQRYEFVRGGGGGGTHCAGDVLRLIVLAGWHGQGCHEVKCQGWSKSTHQQGVGQQRVSIRVTGHQQIEAKPTELEESIVCSLQETTL